jgi:Ni/Co efflux regulator RcnB
MKLVSRLLIAAALLATGNLALAQHGPRDHDRRGQHHERNDHRYDGRRGGHDRHDVRRHDDRHYNRTRVVIHEDHRHYGYDRPRYRHHWQRGHRYGGPIYVVRDYRHYRLRPPPRGYHWVRADNSDYLLVAMATGIILDVALH